MTNEDLSPRADLTTAPGPQPVPEPVAVDEAVEDDATPEERAATVEWLTDEANTPLSGVDAQTGRTVQS